MARVYLIRHGEPSPEGADPGLTARGHEQADAVGADLDRLVPGDAVIVASPLARAHQTAQPLARRREAAITTVHAVRELPSSTLSLPERRIWLREALRGTFADLGDEQRRWRDEIVGYLAGRTTDTVVFSHAVVINAVLGHIAGDDRVLAFVPAHTSVTVLDVDAGAIDLVERGDGQAYADDVV